MAEPVGITGTALAVATLLYSACRVTSDIIDQFKKAPQEYKDLSHDLKALQANTDSLRGAVSSRRSTDGTEADEALSQQEKDALTSLEEPLKTCSAACSQFGDKLAQLTSHSSEDHTSTRDRLRLHFNKSEIVWLKDKLAAAKQTLQVAIGVCTLKTLHQQHTKIEEFRDDTVSAVSQLTGKIEALSLAIETITTSTTPTSTGNQIPADTMLPELTAMKTAMEEHHLYLRQCLQHCANGMAATDMVDRSVRVGQAKAVDRARQVIGNLGAYKDSAPGVVVDTAEAGGDAFQAVGNIDLGSLSKDALDFLAGRSGLVS